MVWSIPGVTCPGVSSLKFLHISRLFTGGTIYEAKKALAPCKLCSATAKISLITPVFSTNPKYRPILATMKKIAQPKPAQQNKYLFRSHRSGNKKTPRQNCPSALYTDTLNTNPPTRIAAAAPVQTVYHVLGDTFCHPDLPSHQELVCENITFVSV